jgi:hypothetical protein
MSRFTFTTKEEIPVYLADYVESVIGKFEYKNATLQEIVSFLEGMFSYYEGQKQ